MVPLTRVAEADNEAMSMVSSEEEIRIFIRQLKSGRASGVDTVRAELLKLGEETAMWWLTELSAKVWDSEVVPLVQDW